MNEAPEKGAGRKNDRPSRNFAAIRKPNTARAPGFDQKIVGFRLDYFKVRNGLDRSLHRMGKGSSALLQELGREPTPSEIAEGMDISMEEVQKTLSISQNHLSLDAPLTPGEDNKLLDYLPDTQNPGPDDQIFEHALTESIEEVLATLKDREAKILRLYFGLEGQDPMTLEEIGSLLGITRERVRQIKEKALARLRHVSRARALESFLS